MKLSRTVAYAVQSILQLAAAPPGMPISCGHLATTGRMPDRFLLQILRKLVQSGILKSIRGVDGGYILAKPITEISLLDLFEAFENPLIPSVPPLEGLSDETRKRLFDSLNRVFASAQAEFSRVKISDLQDSENLPKFIPPKKDAKKEDAKQDKGPPNSPR